MPRPFRFGMVFTDDADASGFAELARRCEGDGFSTLLVADHLDNPMACGPLLVAAAAATTTLRIGSYVYNNDLRHPAVLAKEAATIDVLSGGRLEFGIGAGWNREEYDRAGMTFDPPRIRVDRMEESLDVLQALFAGGPVHHEGTHYRLDGLGGLPRPTQDHIPILVGGGGPRMMGIAAKRADIVGFVPQSKREGGLDRETVPAEVMDARIGALDRAIDDAGRTDGGPERSLLVFDLWRSPDDVTPGELVSPELVETSPYALVGDTSAMIDALEERRDRWGFSYIVCFASDMKVDLFRAVVRRMTA
jgi:probable F420-dependent oxidoreductase